MSSIGERVKAVIVHHGTTMTQFAKELNISQSMVSKICSGKATPSDRTVSDICRIYNVNESWLLRNEGSMTDSNSLEGELWELFKDILPDYPEVKRNFISALAKLPPAAWPYLADHIRELADEYARNPKKISGTYEEGFEAGVRAAQMGFKIATKLNSEPQE